MSLLTESAHREVVVIVVSPTAEFAIRVIPLYGDLLSAFAKPEHKASPLAGRDLGSNPQHEIHKVAGRTQKDLHSLVDDGTGQLAHYL